MKVSFSIEISDEAENDLDDSLIYYLHKSHKVASSFYQQIGKSIEVIESIPFVFPFAYENIRKFNVQNFPFSIYYRIEDQLIRVIAIFHNSRNDQIWKERI